MIDKLYYINLDKRVDRKQHIENTVLPYIDFPKDKIERVSAVDHTSYEHISQRGAGCSLSHIKIWKDAINKKYNKIIIMEDDLQLFNKGEKFNEIINKLSTEVDFCICNLSYNNISPLLPLDNGFFKCYNVQTTSCYVAKVSFLQEILPHIVYATERLMMKDVYSVYAIDQAWKFFQNREDWIVSERVGKQKGSVSDIERRKTDYGV